MAVRPIVLAMRNFLYRSQVDPIFASAYAKYGFYDLNEALTRIAASLSTMRNPQPGGLFLWIPGDIPRHNKLRGLIQDTPELSELFDLDNRGIYLREEISKEEWEDIRDML